MHKAHDVAAAFLTQCGRDRCSEAVGAKFAAFLELVYSSSKNDFSLYNTLLYSKISRSELALPYKLRFALGLIKRGEHGLATVAIHDVLQRLDDDSDLGRWVFLFSNFSNELVNMDSE